MHDEQARDGLRDRRGNLGSRANAKTIGGMCRDGCGVLVQGGGVEDLHDEVFRIGLAMVYLRNGGAEYAR